MELAINYIELAQRVADFIEVLAVGAIAIGVAVAIVATALELVRGVGGHPLPVFKRRMASGLLVSLDLLIAADVLKSVTISPTLENIAGLGLLVVVRTFLSWSLVVEVEHRWPWQEP